MLAFENWTKNENANKNAATITGSRRIKGAHVCRSASEWNLCWQHSKNSVILRRGHHANCACRRDGILCSWTTYDDLQMFMFVISVSHATDAPTRFGKIEHPRQTRMHESHECVMICRCWVVISATGAFHFFLGCRAAPYTTDKLMPELEQSFTFN